MLFKQQPAGGEVLCVCACVFVGGHIGNTLPGNFEVIPIAYAMGETVSLITLIFQY